MKLTVRTKFRIAKVLHSMLRVSRGVLGRGMNLSCKRKGVNWELDLNEGIDLAIYVQGAYEPATLRAYRSLLSPGAIVFDIGANIGAHTLHFAAEVGASGRVYAFEPTDYAFGKLRRNLEINPDLAPRVEAAQVLLNEGTGAPAPDSIYSSWPVNGGRDVHDVHLGRLQTLTGAAAETLDHFCARHEIQRIDLLKLDVDGNEFAVVEGGLETLRKLSPKIILELAPFVHDDQGVGHSFKELIDLFVSIGYVFTDLSSGKRLPQDAAGLDRMIPTGGGLNVLLQPS